jgi:hypothetical protein
MASQRVGVPGRRQAVTKNAQLIGTDKVFNIPIDRHAILSDGSPAKVETNGSEEGTAPHSRSRATIQWGSCHPAGTGARLICNAAIRRYDPAMPTEATIRVLLTSDDFVHERIQTPHLAALDLGVVGMALEGQLGHSSAVAGSVAVTVHAAALTEQR